MKQVIGTQLGFPSYSEIEKMKTGSSTTNYRIKNENGEFLIKLIKKTDYEKKKRLLSNIASASDFGGRPVLISETENEGYYILLFKWLEGRSYFLDKLSPQTFENILNQYLSFISKIKKTDFVLPKVKMEVIETNHDFINKDFSEISKSLDYNPRMTVIHGDFHFKNIIIHKDKVNAFLDFEEFRFGCPTEDLMRLILTNAEQHSFFRWKSTLPLLNTMLEKMNFSKEEWLYGLNVFMYMKYKKKLRKKGFFLLNLLSLYRCSLLYAKVRDVIIKKLKVSF